MSSPEAIAATPAGQVPLLLRALAGEALERPPVWMMRQAGRYLPEYMAVRSPITFLDLCHNADLCCEVTLQPLRRFAFDAGIIFSDILLPLEAMGCPLTFGKGEGPRFPEPIRDRSAVARLKHIDPWRDVPAPLRALQLTTARAGVPILGFAGAPFTLACYLIEGEGSKDWHHTKAMMFNDPEGFGALLDRLADMVGDHLQAQVEAGAAAVQLFDTWAGALAPDDFRRWAAPAARKALSKVKGAPTLYFTRDASPFLPWLHEIGAGSIGLDWRTDMARARATLGPTVPVQGNLDPQALTAPPAVIAAKVQAIIAAAGPAGHVFNLGHGLTPTTPISGVQAAIDAVRSWRWT
jgi:uroporphyrinogen decarboxylase